MGVTNLQFEQKATKGELLLVWFQHIVHPHSAQQLRRAAATGAAPGVQSCRVQSHRQQEGVQLLFPLPFFTEHCTMGQRSPSVLPKGH